MSRQIYIMRLALSISLVSLAFNAICQPSFIDVTASHEFPGFTPSNIYGNGVAAADYDDDGYVDLYISTNGEQRNVLLHNNLGVYEEVDLGTSTTMSTRAALWIDFDGDHLLDLVTGGDCYLESSNCNNENMIQLFRQLENGQFEDVTIESGLTNQLTSDVVMSGLSAGDVNNDGYLDLSIGNRNNEYKFFVNNGDGTFTENAQKRGLEYSGKTYQTLFFDLDRDGHLDILTPVDGHDNLFYQNMGNGYFEEIGTAVGLDSDFNDMGIALGDYDNDADLDIYITNIASINGTSRHNILLENNSTLSNLVFDEIAKTLDVNQGGWGWGTTFFDAENDGDLDLVATNGFNGLGAESDITKYWSNNGNFTFSEMAGTVGLDDSYMATSMISLDFDRDGDLDLVQTFKKENDMEIPIRLMENGAESSDDFGNYIVVKPRMLGANHWAIGSLVKIVMDEEVLIRPILAGQSMFGQEPAEAYFGIGDNTSVEEIIVEWPGGEISSFTEIAGINQIVTVTDEEVLHSPGNLFVTDIDSTSLTLHWSHMSTTETGFIIERSTDSEFGEYEEIFVNENTYSLEEMGLINQTTYFYRVKAQGTEQNSDPSLVLELFTEKQGSANIVLQSPNNIGAELINMSTAHITWKDNDNKEEGYELHRSLDPAFENYLTFELPADSESYESTNLEPSSTYYFRVQAYREEAYSDPSDVVFVETGVYLNVVEKGQSDIYPNPTNSIINIPVSIASSTARGYIVDSFGRKQLNINPQSKEVDVTLLKSGVYFLIVESKGNELRWKFIKE